MEVNVHDERETNSKNVNFTGNKVIDLLTILDINPETVLVTRNDEVLTEDEPLSEDDEIIILSVISGG